MKRPGSTKATNNDAKWIALKKKIRLDAISYANNNSILQCYAGAGLLWSGIVNCKTFKIDADERYKPDYVGDCISWLNKNEFSNYGLIDLDSWGSPAKALDIIFAKKYKGIVVCTYCAPININPCKILAIDYFGSLYNSCAKKSIMAINIDKLLLSYLSKRGVAKVNGYLSKNKCYFWFKI